MPKRNWHRGTEKRITQHHYSTGTDSDVTLGIMLAFCVAGLFRRGRAQNAQSVGVTDCDLHMGGGCCLIRANLCFVCANRQRTEIMYYATLLCYYYRSLLHVHTISRSGLATRMACVLVRVVHPFRSWPLALCVTINSDVRAQIEQIPFAVRNIRWRCFVCEWFWNAVGISIRMALLGLNVRSRLSNYC